MHPLGPKLAKQQPPNEATDGVEHVLVAFEMRTEMTVKNVQLASE